MVAVAAVALRYVAVVTLPVRYVLRCRCHTCSGGGRALHAFTLPVDTLCVVFAHTTLFRYGDRYSCSGVGWMIAVLRMPRVAVPRCRLLPALRLRCYVCRYTYTHFVATALDFTGDFTFTLPVHRSFVHITCLLFTLRYAVGYRCGYGFYPVHVTAHCLCVRYVYRPRFTFTHWSHRALHYVAWLRLRCARCCSFCGTRCVTCTLFRCG